MVIVMLAMRVVVGMIVTMVIGRAPWRGLVPCFVELAGAGKVLRGQNMGRLAPGNGTTRQKQGPREMLPDKFDIVNDGQDGTTFGLPAANQRHEIADGALVDGIERLVEEDQIGVLQDDARKQGALKLAAGQRIERTSGEIFQADGFQRPAEGFAIFRAMPAEQAAAGPKAEPDQIRDAGREGAIEFGLLRQISETRAGPDGAAAGHRPEQAGDRFHKG